ncbi:FUSC family protein [Acetobacter pasteurianus]|uniref:Fusaric acid resistance protein FusB n=2 Tax=Acetobacter pasteurianus TaxID=438 RepID=C7JAW4_ACEP3|nr:FUSC family protein [Acetobacter pasteurianus]BAH98240.1 fusaric acid resistance protein FusB [Acetobacter pasteurianus IFO 3283-01]BAI01291.1 fusaric acid resistance protein FusB [Acetobacter pasteurianus IFO 3283-03]BAI04339.1 fusaric acid resistance protein FusB [Acetobacter pasteurianus IFO 3283-07]BAI07386.1 fusaric acid resistance protein FusB [Acetobacter pasteurianus IFO 3283-22]BAI10434.1 fusaric acid resistance protein FusB [Acetobacter pasteurianus IFO 3283-26]
MKSMTLSLGQLWRSVSIIVRQALVGGGPPRKLDHLRWLFAPNLLSFGYALRTTISSLIALGIALWWELGSPQWAALTVWMVAQGTRGKSIAKARWHMFGMVVGTICAIVLVASMPQSPLLYIFFVAVGIGTFCFIGTLLPGPAAMTNYRIHGMRASGFTYVIIALDGIVAPDHIFQIAMARATYITLGIVVETTISSLFQYQLGLRARTRLATNFVQALKGAVPAILRLLQGDRRAVANSPGVFSTLIVLSDQVEFAEIEMGKHQHEGDHARAALAAITVLLSRGLDLGALLEVPHSQGVEYQDTARQVSSFLQALPDRLDNDQPIEPVLRDLTSLRATCRQLAASCLEKEMEAATHPPMDVNQEEVLTRQGQLLHKLDTMLEELYLAIEQFEMSRNPQPHDHFRYPMKSYRDWRMAFTNSLRASVTIFLAGVIWITTAWPDGLTFIMFVGIVCALFSTLEQPALATQAFLHGTVCVIGMSALLDLWVMAQPTIYEMMAMCLAVPMLIGGLAFAWPPLVLAAVAYNLFLPILVGPINQGRMDEIMYFNTAMPLLLAMMFCMWMYRVFLPYDPDGLRWDMRVNILRGLRRLAGQRRPPAVTEIIGRSVDGFVRLSTMATDDGNTYVLERYLSGVLSSMTIALNVMRLRTVLAKNILPPEAQKAVEVMMERMQHFTGRYGGQYGRTARATHIAVEYLLNCEETEANLSVREEMLRALASLRVIETELAENRAFFDASSPYLDKAFT